MATAHDHAHVLGGSCGRVYCGSIESLVYDAYDWSVVRVQRGPTGFSLP